MHRPLCLCLLLFSPLAWAEPKPPLTLNAAVDLALARAPQLTAGSAALDAAQSLRISAGRLPDPEAVVGIENLPVNGADSFSTTRDFMTMRKVGVMQAFPAPGKRRLERVRADAQVEVAGAELAATRFDVAREAAMAWVRYAAALTAVERLCLIEPEAELAATSARGAFKAGRASAADALAAEAAVIRLRSRLLQLQGDSDRSKAELARWIGDDAISTPASMPSMDELPGSVEVLRESAHLHVGILPFDARIAAAQVGVDIARAERRPGWSAELSYAKRGPDFSDMASLQFTIDLPLFARTRQNPMIAARSAEVRQLQAERDAELQMHRSELQQMLISWQQLGQQIALNENEQLPLARERSRVALAAYRAGQGDLPPALAAFEEEAELLIDRATLESGRAEAWTYLRYLDRTSPAGGH
ncbi:MAG: TolC family protein [Pseudomonadota bacterium]